jgi:hypothetical protein
MKKALTDCAVSVESDVYVAGRDEFGTEVTAEIYFVMLEDAKGYRWAHDARFAGCEVVEGEESDNFVDVRAEARAAADKLLARIEAAGEVDMAFWGSRDPAYGSDAYLAEGGDYEQVLRERVEA